MKTGVDFNVATITFLAKKSLDLERAREIEKINDRKKSKQRKENHNIFFLKKEETNRNNKSIESANAPDLFRSSYSVELLLVKLLIE